MPRANSGRAAWGAPAARRRAAPSSRKSVRFAALDVATGLEDPAWDSGEAGRLPQRPPTCDESAGHAGMDQLTKLSRAMWEGKGAVWDLIYEQRGRDLWSSDYKPLLRREDLEAPLLREQVVQVYSHQVSTYRARLKDPRLTARYDAKTGWLVRDTTAVLRRRRNQNDIPFSIMARSISYFNQRVPTRVWRENQCGLRITHRDTAEKCLDAMLATEPPPPFVVNEHVVIFGMDQCNHWQVAKNTRGGLCRAAERLNVDGMPVHIRSTTVLNWVQVYVPFSEPLLTPDEIELIRDKGPYTEDPARVFAPLNPLIVEQKKWKWVGELLARVAPTDEETGELRMPQNEAETVGRALGKPLEKPDGPSQFKIHAAIQNCDTKSFRDCQKIWSNIANVIGTYVLIVIVFCDGQLVERWRNCKVRWPADYKKLVIGDGMFHSLAHLSFTINEGWWPCCCCMFAKWQHKDKQVVPDAWRTWALTVCTAL